MISRRIKSKSKFEQVFLFVYKCERKKFNKEFKDVRVTYVDSQISIEHRQPKTINDAEKRIHEMIAQYCLIFVPEQRRLEELEDFTDIKNQYSIEVISKNTLDVMLKGFSKLDLSKMIDHISYKIKKANGVEIAIMDSDGKKRVKDLIEMHFRVSSNEQAPIEVHKPAREEQSKQGSKEEELKPIKRINYRLKQSSIKERPADQPDEIGMRAQSIIHLPNPVSRKILMTESLSYSVYDQADFKQWLSSHSQLKLQDINIKKCGDMVQIQLIGETDDNIPVFKQYFNHRECCFFRKEEIEQLKEHLYRLKLKYPMLRIHYVSGYCPYTTQELQSQWIVQQLIIMIESQHTIHSKNNCYEFHGISFVGLRNIVKTAHQECKLQLYMAPQIQKPQIQSWLVVLPEWLVKNCRDIRIKNLVNRQFVICFKSTVQDKAQLLNYELTSQGMRCNVKVLEPKRKAQSYEMLKKMMVPLLKDKFVQFECKYGLTVDELYECTLSLQNQLAFVQDGSTIFMVSTDANLINKLIMKLEDLKTSQKMRVLNHIFEHLSNGLQSYAIPGTTITADGGREQTTIIIKGYKQKVERVRDNIQRLLDTIGQNNMRTETIIVSQEEHQICKLDNSFDKLQADLAIRILQEQQQSEQIILTFNSGKSIILSSQQLSNHDNRDYVNVFYTPNDWAKYIPDQALEAVYSKKLLPSKKALYTPRLEQFDDATFNEYNGKLQDKLVSRVCLLMPEGNSMQAFKILLQLLKTHQTMSCVVVHPRKQIPYKQLKTLIKDFKEEISKQVKIPPKPSDNLLPKLWYCSLQNGTRQAYSNQANDKLNKAYKSSKVSLELTEEDMPSVIDTHYYLRSSHQIVHIKSNITFQLKKEDNPYLGVFEKFKFWNDSKSLLFEYELNGYRSLPKTEIAKINQSQTQQVPITLALYQIDLTKMTQRNLFSGFQRRISFVEDVPTKPAHVNEPTTQKVEQQKRVRINIEGTSRHAVTRGKFSLAKILEDARNCRRQIKFDTKLMPVAQAFNYCFEKGIIISQSKLEGDICVLKGLSSNRTDLEALDIICKSRKLEVTGSNQMINLPQHWKKHSDDYSFHNVDPGSKEFQQVSLEFKIRPIQALYRIQNKYIWKRYLQQKAHLQEISKRSVPQMYLFHGTKTNDPAKIYQDKQEAFNINYSSDNNMFGRGIYFAKEASYSHGYSYRHPSKKRHIMLYCKVLVGTSQEMTHTEKCRQIMDTEVRDLIDKIKYESIKSNYHGSDIYIIYKSRRAYPQYVIQY